MGRWTVPVTTSITAMDNHALGDNLWLIWS